MSNIYIEILPVLVLIDENKETTYLTIVTNNLSPHIHGLKTSHESNKTYVQSNLTFLLFEKLYDAPQFLTLEFSQQTKSSIRWWLHDT